MAENRYIGIDVVIRTEEAQAKLEELQKDLEQLGDKMQKQIQRVAQSKQEWKDAVKTYGEASEQAAKLKIALEDQKDELNKTKKAYKETKQELTSLEKGTGKYADQTKDATSVADDFTAALKRSTVGSVTLGTALGVLAAKAITGLGRALKQSIKDIIEEGTAFEVAFTEVRKTVDTTEEGYQALARTIQGMSLVLPEAAKDIAEIVALGGQLGIATDALDVFAETAVRLGVSTNLSATEAGESIARFANIMRTDQKDFDRIGSTLVELGNNFATTESEILNMAKSLASIGNQVDLSESEVIGYAAALSSLGLETERGSSALTKFFAKVNTAVHSGSEQLEKYAEVAGMTIEEFSSLGTAEASRVFIEGLAKIKEGGGDVVSILTEMGVTEVRVRDAILRLAGNTDLLTRSINMANKAWEENIALNEESNKFFDTLQSRTKLLSNSLSYLRRSLYEAFESPLKNIVGSLTSVINAINGQKGATEGLVSKTDALVGALKELDRANKAASESTDALTRAQQTNASIASVEALRTLGKQLDASLKERENTQKKYDRLLKELGDDKSVDALLEVFGSYERVNEVVNAYRSSSAPEFTQEELERLTRMPIAFASALEGYQRASELTLEAKGYSEQLKQSGEGIAEGIEGLLDAVDSGLITMQEAQAAIGLNGAEVLQAAWEGKGKASILDFSTESEEMLEGLVSDWEEMLSEVEPLSEKYFEIIYKMLAAQSEMDSRKAQAETQDYVSDTMRDELQDSLDEIERYYSQLEGSEADFLKAELNLWDSFLKQLTTNETERLIEAGQYTREQVDEWIEEAKQKRAELESAIASLPTDTTKVTRSSVKGITAFSNSRKGVYNEVEDYGLGAFGNKFVTVTEDVLSDVSYWTQEIGNVISDAYDSWITAIENRMEELEAKYEELLAQAEETANEKIASANAMYSSESMTEQEYMEAVEAAQAEALASQIKAEKDYNKQMEALDAEKEEAERQQFEANKANSIAEALISGAQAILAAWKDGPVVGAIMSALIGALTATQVGIIASQKFSAYAEGGIIDKPTMALMGEEGKEAVVPLENNTGWLDEVAEKVAGAISVGGGASTYNTNSRTLEFIQNITSPKALNRREIYKNTRYLLRQVGRA